MKIVRSHFLRGPSVWSRKPCLLAVLDLQDLDDVSSSAVPGFNEALLQALPTLSEHGCSYGEPGGFLKRLEEGTYMAHVTEHVLIELQCVSGSYVAFGKARMIRGKPRHYNVVCRYTYESLVTAALPVAVKLVGALARQQPYDLAADLEELRAIVRRCELGPSTRAVLDAARERGIPFRRLTESSSLFQLGYGKAQRRFQATITSQTGFIATDIASDKDLTKMLIREAGIPVPEGSVVREADAAVAAFRHIGAPVTVKPLASNQGKGATPYVDSESGVRAAFENARLYGRKVIVERFIPGSDYRVLVVNGRVAAVSLRLPPTVTGDGVSTIRELVERENRNPMRGEGHGTAMTFIALDEHVMGVLTRHGLTVDSVLPAGERCVLRTNANLSTGGSAEDVTDQIHPETARVCERAVRRIGLDVAGVDLICEDISRPLGEQKGAIVEVNAAPGIRMHEEPAAGLARSAGASIVESLYPEQADGRIPVIAVTGTNGKTTTVLAIAHVFETAQRCVGVATTEGVRIAGHPVQSGDCSGYWSARMVLEDPEVEVAVLEVARGGILRRGLGFDRCDVAVMLNVSSDHLGQDGINNVEELARVKAVVVDSARKAVVLNAQDDHCLNMRDQCDPAARIWLFARDPTTPALREHLAGGGCAVTVQEDNIVLHHGNEAHIIAPVAGLPMTARGLATFNVDNALAATAACLAVGLNRGAVASALTSFVPDVASNPMRLNLFDVEGITLIVDYAHNAASYRLLLDFARRITRGRLCGIVTAPGDRQDTDLQEIGRICAAAMDHMTVYEMDQRRGRSPGTIAAQLVAGAAGTTCALHTCLNVREALRNELQQCQPGDTLVFGCASSLQDLAEFFARMQPLHPASLRSVADEGAASVPATPSTGLNLIFPGPDRRLRDPRLPPQLAAGQIERRRATLH